MSDEALRSRCDHLQHVAARLKAERDEARRLADQLAEALIADERSPTVGEADALLAYGAARWVRVRAALEEVDRGE